MSWFPRPESERDLELLEPPSDWTAARAFALLVDPTAEEWPHKVGVAGPLDGSAKTSTRLLAAGGWVYKTRLDQAFSSLDAARAKLAEDRRSALATGLWHEQKVWASLRSGDAFLPLTICRELRTLRQIARRDERLLAWIEMIRTGIDADRRYGLGLDLNPANFGQELGASRLYYLDEETYLGLDARAIASAIVARIPEEATADETVWRAWGASLSGRLSQHARDWPAVCEEIGLYPLPERFHSRRAALLSSLAPERARTHRSTRHGASDITCVLADVHGNLAALEAVLSVAKCEGADQFLFLGDAVGYGPEPKACVARLAELPRAIQIRGNHDHAIASGELNLGMNELARRCAEWTQSALGPSELAWLAALPVEHIGAEWMAVHGAPRDPRRFFAYVYELTYEDNLRDLRDRRMPVCFHGHSHVQMAHAELAAGPTKIPGPCRFQLDPRYRYLVNPGSVGQPRDGDPRAAFALWNRRTGEFSALRAPYDVGRTVRAIRAQGLPEQLERRLATGT